MPGNPSECREHAKNCYRLAADAHTKQGKEHFESLAQKWLALAADLEAVQALLDAWGAPIEPHPTPLAHQGRAPIKPAS